MEFWRDCEKKPPLLISSKRTGREIPINHNPISETISIAPHPSARLPSVFSCGSLPRLDQATIYKANTVQHPAINLHNAPSRFTGGCCTPPRPPPLPQAFFHGARACIGSNDRGLRSRAIARSAFYTPYLGLELELEGIN